MFYEFTNKTTIGFVVGTLLIFLNNNFLDLHIYRLLSTRNYNDC